MPLGVFLSALLHLAVVLVLVVGLPWFTEPPEFFPPVPVEVVTIDVEEPAAVPEPEPASSSSWHSFIALRFTALPFLYAAIAAHCAAE